jgi:type I restriction enzyme M protein
MAADGFSLDDKRQPIEANDIPDLLGQWRQRDPQQDTNRGGKAFFVPKGEIKANGYDLSINRYKEVAYEEVSYEPPMVLLGKLRALEAEILEDLDVLEGMLEGGSEG